MVSIPRAVAQRCGIEPGWKLDWSVGETPDVLIVHLVPDRKALARRLQGAGRALSGTGQVVEGLVAEREADSE